MKSEFGSTSVPFMCTCSVTSHGPGVLFMLRSRPNTRSSIFAAELSPVTESLDFTEPPSSSRPTSRPIPKERLTSLPLSLGMSTFCSFRIKPVQRQLALGSSQATNVWLSFLSTHSGSVNGPAVFTGTLQSASGKFNGFISHLAGIFNEIPNGVSIPDPTGV